MSAVLSIAAKLSAAAVLVICLVQLAGPFVDVLQALTRALGAH